jgi:hypothetical protein
MTSPNEQQVSAEGSQPRSTEQARRHGWLVKPGGLRKPAWPAQARWLVIVPSVLAVMGLSVALVYLIAAGSPHPAASSGGPVGTSASPNPDATEAAPLAPIKPRVVAVAAPGSDALPLPKGLRAQVKAWDAGSGGAALAAVSNQFGNAMQAGGVREYVEMKRACLKLAASVKTAQAEPPIPDAAMQELYAKALSMLVNGASDCVAAISEQPDGDEYNVTTENPTMLHTAMSALSGGSKDLYRATAEIVILSRGH